MSYDEGSKVMLRDDLEAGRLYDTVKFTTEMYPLRGQTVKIKEKIPQSRPHQYKYKIAEGVFISEYMVDKIKTIELNKDSALIHYLKELGKLGDKRQIDEYTKALMKYGRREGDNLDSLKNINPEKQALKEIDYILRVNFNGGVTDSHALEKLERVMIKYKEGRNE